MRMLVLQFSNRIELETSCADDFLLDAARLIDVLVLDVDDGIDPVLALQRSKAVLETPASKRVAIAARRHALEVQLAGPPTG